MRPARLSAVRNASAGRVLLGLGALQLVALYVVLRNSSWVYDDNFFLVLAGQEGFTWHWLSSVQFEHWDIGEHVLISLQHRLFYLDFRWALALMLALLGGCIFFLQRTLAMLTAKRWVAVAFAVWFGVNILWVRPLQWWADGVQALPYTFFDLVCLYAFVRFQAERRRRWIAISALALAAAFLFYEKPAYMLVYLVLMRVLLMSDDLRPRVVLETLWRERALWLAYLAVIAVWAIGYLDSHAYTSHGSVALGEYLAYMRILWLQTLVPSLASVTIPAANLGTLQLLFVVLAQLAVVAAVVVSLRRRPSAWRAWAFLAVVFVFNAILVAHSRVPIFGVDVGNDPRYLVDYTWLVPLALCAAFARERTLIPHTPARALGLAPPARRAVAALAVALGLAYLAGSIASAVHLESAWAGPQGRSWAERVRSGIAAAERSGRRPVVAGDVTPFEIMEEFVAPYNRLERVLPMYVGPIQVDGPLDAPLVLLENDGSVRRAAFVAPAASAGMALQLLRTRQLVVGAGGRVVAQAGRLCVIADGTAVDVERRISPAPTVSAPYYVRLGYRVFAPTQLSIRADVGQGMAPGADHAMALSPRSDESIGWVGPGVPRAVSLAIPPLTTVCLGRFDIDRLRPAE